MQDSVEQMTEADARLMKNVAVVHRIGFADIILPGLLGAAFTYYLHTFWPSVCLFVCLFTQNLLTRD